MPDGFEPHDSFDQADTFDPADAFDPADTDDALLDQAIRRRLGAVLPTDPAPPVVLDELRRPLRRARLVRRSQLVVGAAAAIMMVAAVSRVMPNDPQGTTLIAASPTTEAKPAPTLSVTEGPTPSISTSSEATSTTSNTIGDPPARTSTAVADPNPPPSTTMAPGSTSTTAPPTSGTSQTTPTTTGSAPPSTTAGTQPTDPPTTVDSSGRETISSACGTITASIDGSSILLASTQEFAGFTTVVGNDGPEELEVRFTGSTGTCEIAATVRRGQIESEVSFESADGHDTEDDSHRDDTHSNEND